mmetsp:Transcript_40924/g.99719  ORF Transcript_40924/g.99719 Transcript_40924/m.99719 type:complete len:233 (-) Transcript_40924:89-787(-)
MLYSPSLTQALAAVHALNCAPSALAMSPACPPPSYGITASIRALRRCCSKATLISMTPRATNTLSLALTSAKAFFLCPCTLSSSSSSASRLTSLVSLVTVSCAFLILGSSHPIMPLPVLSSGPIPSPTAVPTLVAPSQPNGLTVLSSYDTKIRKNSRKGTPAPKKNMATTLPSQIPSYTLPLHSVNTSAATTGLAPSIAHVPLEVTLPQEAEASSKPGATHVQLSASKSTFS